MSIDLEEARKLYRLARLQPGSPESEAEMVRDLQAIVEYFDQLSGFEALPEPDDEAQAPSREADDRLGPQLNRRMFERNAPEERDGFLVVPRIKAGAAKA